MENYFEFYQKICNMCFNISYISYYWSQYSDFGRYIQTAEILRNKQFRQNYVILLALVTMGTL